MKINISLELGLDLKNTKKLILYMILIFLQFIRFFSMNYYIISSKKHIIMGNDLYSSFFVLSAEGQCLSINVDSNAVKKICRP